jgi:hypothetical protein
MELRARTRPTLRRIGLMAALPALLVPAVAGTTVAAAKTRAPVVKRITPKHVYVGETLTIHGRYFRRGINKNTVAFKRNGAKAVFVKAEKGTTKLLKVTLPKRLEKALVVRNGTPTPTRLNVRVLAKKFGKRFTSGSKSPVVGPEKPPAPPKPATVDPNGDCDGDGQLNRIDADDDNDLLADGLEKSLKLDSCNVDSDGDGVEDGYEYRSAKDLNDAAVPYPLKKPYPNPLDGTDANTDHDGDTLSLLQEYRLWKYTISAGGPRTLSALSYSAGEQYSKGRLLAATYDKQAQFMSWAGGHGFATVSLVNLNNPAVLTLATPPLALPDRWATHTSYPIRDIDRSGAAVGNELTYFDTEGNGVLDDAERDEDADGLPNQWENSGCMTQDYWEGLYDKEKPYYLKYAGVSLVDPDTDGDGIRDGADDQDHDDIPNLMECSRAAAYNGTAGSWAGFVNPFNPCLPHPRSRTCKIYVEVGASGEKWAPFEDTAIYNAYYLIKN